MRSRVPLPAAALGVLLAGLSWAAAPPLPAKPTKYVTDRANVMSPARLEALNQRLAAFERETSNQILVVIDRRVPANTTLEEMGASAIRAWGVGRKGRDNGVIFFVFVDDRVMRVEVGYGLEGAIPDVAAKRITNDTVKPFFKRGDYAGGIEAGAAAIVAAARREGYAGTRQAAAPRPRPVRQPVSPQPTTPAISFAAFWALVGRTVAIGAGLAAVILIAFRFVSGRAVSEEPVLYGRAWMAAWGVGTAIVAGFQSEWLFAGISFVVGLLFLVDYSSSGQSSSSSNDYSSSSSTSYESSSSSYESSSSSSSGSDFSGGGGDGGGGGSSDSW